MGGRSRVASPALAWGDLRSLVQLRERIRDCARQASAGYGLRTFSCGVLMRSPIRQRTVPRVFVQWTLALQGLRNKCGLLPSNCTSEIQAQTARGPATVQFLETPFTNTIIARNANLESKRRLNRWLDTTTG